MDHNRFTEGPLRREPGTSAEAQRLAEGAARKKNWQRWGPYLAERQWATVREDYSPNGDSWGSFPHEHARSRTYRWGEDGLLGITDRECRLCFAVALWNGHDAILKERLFGLTGPEGNHGEDVKEEYFYLDATPTASYLKALYKYPQSEFPYARLVSENRTLGRDAPEFELADTGVFDDGRYFDVVAEYAKESPDDILIRITVSNRGPVAAECHVLPTIWFRNTWTWGCMHEGCSMKPHIAQKTPNLLSLNHETLGLFHFEVGPDPSGHSPTVLFTENESNLFQLYGAKNISPFVKDAFHDFVVNGRTTAVNPKACGTKAAPHYRLHLASGESQTIRLRLYPDADSGQGNAARPVDQVFADRIHEADDFYNCISTSGLAPDKREVVRQGYAGLIWTKQFYHYVVGDWLDGDPNTSPPPPQRRRGRNSEWAHLHSRDIFSMPDKWEYPWFAAWDLAFHTMLFARVDPAFAKHQLTLLLREWYLHPNGQLPAYEFVFGDVNPPVHAWAAWRVYKISASGARRDRDFLESVFQKLLLNFTWWVNRKDVDGKNIFAGGFLGLDNIGVFDRSKPLPGGGALQQADGTAWMAFYCLTMLRMALELAWDGDRVRPAYEDMASKFFEHFVQITDAMNSLGGTGLWDEVDGVYYDQLEFDRKVVPLKTRSLVSLLPLIAVEVLEEETINRLPGFSKRLDWFLMHRRDLARHIAYCDQDVPDVHQHRLLAIPSRERLIRLLRYLFDEEEFLSPFGIRSLSKFHAANPYIFAAEGQEHRVQYTPGESNGSLFGGNSNWRGPIWFPLNYLLIEALERYHYFYGESLKVECPTGSGNWLNLRQASREIATRLTKLFLPQADGRRPCHGEAARFQTDPHWRDLVLFHEYFHAETGKGLGASHQTGWTALVIRYLEESGLRP